MPRINSPAELEQLRQDILSKQGSRQALHLGLRRRRLPRHAARARSSPPSRRKSKSRGLTDEVRRQRDRLPRLLRAGPDRRHRPRGDLLPPGEAGGRSGDRRRRPSRRRRSSSACSTSTRPRARRRSARPTFRSTRTRSGSSSATTSRSIRRASTTTSRSAAIRRWPRRSSR